MERLRTIRLSKAQLRAAILTATLALCILLFTTLTFTAEQRSDIASKIGATLPDRVKDYIPQVGGPKNHDDDDWAKKGSDYRILTSIRNPRGYSNKINVDKTGHKIINPTIVELPRAGKNRHDFVLIARTTHVDVEIEGKKFKQSREMATFVDLTIDDKLQRPVLKAQDDWSRLLLDHLNDTKHHCMNQPDMDKYIGPEDMKLFWTRAGEPLVIYTYHVDDPVQCQGQWIVDLRAIMPELAQEVGSRAAALMGPVRFDKPVLLRRKPEKGEETSPRYQREKNWAPVQSPFSNDTELLFMVEPGRLFRLHEGETFLEPVTKDAETESRVEAPYPPYVEPGETWYSDSHTCLHDVYQSDPHVHQATPMLSVTLCNRGTCTPTAANTVLIGLIHRRYDHPTWYDRRIAAYSPVAPYNMVSVSKRLDYLGEEDGTYSWTGSMTYYTRHKAFPPSNHGYLDDEVLMSFGIKDRWAGWMDVRAADLVRDHYMCEGAQVGYHLRAMSGANKHADRR